MSFISSAKHLNFIQHLKSSVEIFGGLSQKEDNVTGKIGKLREDLNDLEKLYNEYIVKTNELKVVINKYNHIQKNARVLLRKEKFKYTRSLASF